MSYAIRRASELTLDETTVTALRAALKTTADEVVQAIIEEVPPYARALSGRMGATIRRAVRTALGHYLDLASGKATGGDAGDAAYELGRGEVRDGRSMDALLSAYRVGARVAWRCLAAGAVPAGLPAAEVAKFAELTFAYIDELSAASAAGHADELAARGRDHERHLEHLARDLLAGASPDALLASGQRARWQPPVSLTAVLLPAAQARPAYRTLDPNTLVLDDLPDDTGVLLVPDADRSRLLRQLTDRAAVVGPGPAVDPRVRLVRTGPARALPFLRHPRHRGPPARPGAQRRRGRVRRPARPSPRTVADPACRNGTTAGGDVAGVAAAPGQAGRGRGGVVRPSPDGPLPDVAAAGAVSRSRITTPGP
ncbi:hypothetical protein DER30_3316 [Streptomyces sp. HB202]|nr:hypothetical protein DER30_3316 [Streptomyces sp. HB202]